jgi:hypothetical protein
MYNCFDEKKNRDLLLRSSSESGSGSHAYFSPLMLPTFLHDEHKEQKRSARQGINCQQCPTIDLFSKIFASIDNTTAHKQED